jgi:GntR family transcriptional regulator
MTALDIHVDPNSPVPLYHQISDQLKTAINDGRLPKSTFLPNEIELAGRWGVSRPTVRRGIQELVDLGMLVRRRGIGTQVVAAQVRRRVRLSSLWDDLIQAGQKPTSTVLRCEIVASSPEIATELEAEPGTPVIALERVRLADSTPLAIMRNWLITDGIIDLVEADLEINGLYDQLRKRGVQPHIARQVIGACAASPDEAELLELDPGAPLLTMRRWMQDVSGTIVEHGSHSYDAARYAVEMMVVDGA